MSDTVIEEIMDIFFIFSFGKKEVCPLRDCYLHLGGVCLLEDFYLSGFYPFE